MRVLTKSASFRARNFKHVADYLRMNPRGVEGDDVAKAVREMYGKDGGTGSMFLDAGKWVLDKTPGIKKLKLGAKIDTLNSKLKEKMIDADLRSGHYVANKLRNTKLKNIFVEKRKVRLKNSPEEADQLVEIETPSLAAPISKVKDKVLPFVGAMTIADMANKAVAKHNAKKLQDKGPDESGDINMKTAEDNRSEIIDQIVSAVTEKQAAVAAPGANDNEQLLNLSKLAMDASDMLKVASAKIRSQDEMIEKMAEEGRLMELTLIAMSRSERCIKLARLMVEKGITKTADYDFKIDEIMEMDDKAFELLSQTVNSIQKESSDNSGVTNLTFLERDGRINAGKKTFEEDVAEEVLKLSR